MDQKSSLAVHYSHFVIMKNILYNGNSYVNGIQVNIYIGWRNVQMLEITLYTQQQEFRTRASWMERQKAPFTNMV